MARWFVFRGRMWPEVPDPKPRHNRKIEITPNKFPVRLDQLRPKLTALDATLRLHPLADWVFCNAEHLQDVLAAIQICGYTAVKIDLIEGA